MLRRQGTQKSVEVLEMRVLRKLVNKSPREKVINSNIRRVWKTEPMSQRRECNERTERFGADGVVYKKQQTYREESSRKTEKKVEGLH